jgi:hypothetical protein
MFLDIYNRMSDMIEEGQQQHQMWIHREEEVRERARAEDISRQSLLVSSI